MRLFVAVDIGQDCRVALAQAMAKLKAAGADVKWIRRENLHVTLNFLGHTREDPEKIAVALNSTRQKKYAMEIRGIGALPNLVRPRIIYAGITEGGQELGRTAQFVSTALEPLGCKGEVRAFLPHVTIGRVKSPKGTEKLAQKMSEQESENFGKIPVDGFLLMKSDLGPGGPVYTKLAEIPLV